MNRIKILPFSSETTQHLQQQLRMASYDTVSIDLRRRFIIVDDDELPGFL